MSTSPIRRRSARPAAPRGTAAGGTIDRRFRAFDARTGAELWETTLEASAHATPMTFMGRDGRQYVVIAAGGDGLLESRPGSKMVAFALPAAPSP
jgi:quinoprotein glucose dehydrogenase